MKYDEGARDYIARAIAAADERNGAPPYEHRIAMGKHVKECLFEQADAVLDAVREAGGWWPMWEPIKTAPKVAGTARTGYWVLGGWSSRGANRYWKAEWPRYREYDRWVFVEIGEPTHWTRLPTPPPAPSSWPQAEAAGRS